MSTAPAKPRGGFVLEVRVETSATADHTVYPWSLPSVRQLTAAERRRRDHGLELHPWVSFLVGENGCGTSTLLEALAVALRLNPEGRSRDHRLATRPTESDLGADTTAGRGGLHGRDTFFLRAESRYTAALESTREQLGDHQGREVHQEQAVGQGEAQQPAHLHLCGDGGVAAVGVPAGPVRGRGAQPLGNRGDPHDEVADGPTRILEDGGQAVVDGLDAVRP